MASTFTDMASLLRQQQAAPAAIPATPGEPAEVPRETPPPLVDMSSLLRTPAPAVEEAGRIPFLSSLADIPRLYREEKAGALQDLEGEGARR